jgi:hypothetical protein
MKNQAEQNQKSHFPEKSLKFFLASKKGVFSRKMFLKMWSYGSEMNNKFWTPFSRGNGARPQGVGVGYFPRRPPAPLGPLFPWGADFRRLLPDDGHPFRRLVGSSRWLPNVDEDLLAALVQLRACSRWPGSRWDIFSYIRRGGSSTLVIGSFPGSGCQGRGFPGGSWLSIRAPSGSSSPPAAGCWCPGRRPKK